MPTVIAYDRWRTIGCAQVGRCERGKPLFEQLAFAGRIGIEEAPGSRSRLP
jgi:hypothetical protein